MNNHNIEIILIMDLDIFLKIYLNIIHYENGIKNHSIDLDPKISINWVI